MGLWTSLSLSSVLAKRFGFFAAGATGIPYPAAVLAQAVSSNSLPESASESLVNSSWAGELALEAARDSGRDGFDGKTGVVASSASLSVSSSTSIDSPIPYDGWPAKSSQNFQMWAHRDTSGMLSRSIS